MTDLAARSTTSEITNDLCGKIRGSTPKLALPCSATGRPFNPDTLCRHFHWLYKNSGVSGASSHSGRKPFLTTLANKGISIHILASPAGRRSISVTNRYVTANEDLKRNAVELV